MTWTWSVDAKVDDSEFFTLTVQTEAQDTEAAKQTFRQQARDYYPDRDIDILNVCLDGGNP